MAEPDNNFIPPSRDFSEPPPSRGGLVAWLKNLMVFLLLLVVVAASFWLSFQLGKRLVAPAKNINNNKIEVAIPEPPPSIKALQKLQAALSTETERELNNLPPLPKPAQAKVKPATKAVIEPVTKPKTSPKKAAVTKPNKKTIGKHYYKIQAGVYGDLSSAKGLSAKVRAAGFDCFVRKVRGGWRVQAGAYKTKGEAAGRQSALQSQGFEATIIYE